MRVGRKYQSTPVDSLDPRLQPATYTLEYCEQLLRDAPIETGIMATLVEMLADGRKKWWNEALGSQRARTRRRSFSA